MGFRASRRNKDKALFQSEVSWSGGRCHLTLLESVRVCCSACFGLRDGSVTTLAHVDCCPRASSRPEIIAAISKAKKMNSVVVQLTTLACLLARGRGTRTRTPGPQVPNYSGGSRCAPVCATIQLPSHGCRWAIRCTETWWLEMRTRSFCAGEGAE